MKSVFISYSSKNREAANYIADYLRHNGVDIFIDHIRLQAGNSFSAQLRNEITRRDVFVLLVSPNSISSKWVQAELNLAHGLDKPIIPVMLEDIDIKDSHFWFISHEEQVRLLELGKTEEMMGNPLVETGLEKLLRALSPQVISDNVVEGTRRIGEETSIRPLEWLERFPILARFPQVRSMRITRPVTEGKSGSKVFIVKAAVQSSPRPQTCFLKIHHSQGNTPLLRHQQAFKTFKVYMPAVVDSTPWDPENHQIAMLYSAKKTVDSAIALEDLLRTSGKQARDLIARTCDAIAGWNSPIDFDEDYQFTPIMQLMKRALAHSVDETLQYRRLEDPEASIFARLEREFGLTENATTLNIDGKTDLVPNPLAYFRTPRLWGDLYNKPVAWLCGHVHGDLNVRNVLSLDGRSDSLAIIDFDTYDAANLIFLDFFQLELGVILTLMPPANSIHQRELIRLSDYLARNLLLDDVPDLGVMGIGVNTMLQPIRDKLTYFWQDDEDLITSIWMARMAVGLELSRKHKITRPERAFALLYAADSLKSLLQYLRLEPEKVGVPVNITWDA